MNNASARWSMPEGHDIAPKGKTVQYSMDVDSNPVNKSNEVALKAASISVEALSKATDKLEAENRQLKTMYDSVNAINTRLQQSNDKLSEENFNLKAQIKMLQDASATVKAPSMPEEVAYAFAQPVSMVSRTSVAPNKSQKVEPVKYETAYVAPLNPMTMFVEFLEELNILDEYTEILLKDGNSFENLCLQYTADMYISEVCTDDSGEYLEGWEDADTLWMSIVEDDGLDELEAYIE